MIIPRFKLTDFFENSGEAKSATVPAGTSTEASTTSLQTAKRDSTTILQTAKRDSTATPNQLYFANIELRLVVILVFVFLLFLVIIITLIFIIKKRNNRKKKDILSNEFEMNLFFNSNNSLDCRKDSTHKKNEIYNSENV